jgi:hypothetical protein
MKLPITGFLAITSRFLGGLLWCRRWCQSSQGKQSVLGLFCSTLCDIDMW